LLEQCLPFERRIIELEDRLERAETDPERETIQVELDREREAVFSNLTAWQRVQLARHPLRPRMLDYTSRILEDLFELHGDRYAGDDPAMVCGLGRFRGKTVMVVGQQKGVTTEEKVTRNFGMAHPEGYRKALRMFKLAERMKIPVVTFVDTPAAHPGIEAEARGQGPAIAQNLYEMIRLKTPIFCAVLAEGGSGGALGIAVGDWIVMLEHAIYVICPPERCAEILWRDVEKKEMAASAMRVTAQDLLRLGAIDKVLEEPPGGAHRDPDAVAATLAEELDVFLSDCAKGRWSPENRQRKFRKMGVWRENGRPKTSPDS
jgi:acetyl-CoA carboxylase carboxyl transferase subunit alpha